MYRNELGAQLDAADRRLARPGGTALPQERARATVRTYDPSLIAGAAPNSCPMQSLEDLLADHSFFAGLERDTLALIAGCASNLHYRPGEYLFRQGGAADRFYVLRRGQVQLEVAAPERGPLALETYGEGDVLGWAWIVPPYRWEADAQSTEHTDVIAFDGLCLRIKCDENPALGYELLKRAARAMNTRLFGALVRLLDLYGPVR